LKLPSAKKDSFGIEKRKKKTGSLSLAGSPLLASSADSSPVCRINIKHRINHYTQNYSREIKANGKIRKSVF